MGIAQKFYGSSTKIPCFITAILFSMHTGFYGAPASFFLPTLSAWSPGWGLQVFVPGFLHNLATSEYHSS